MVFPPVFAWIGTGVINAVGFGSGGIAAGSKAAVIHALIGNVGARSAFAALQSAGATGTGTLVSGIGAGTPVLLALSSGLLYRILKLILLAVGK
jgi:hypothetical protein